MSPARMLKPALASAAALALATPAMGGDVQTFVFNIAPINIVIDGFIFPDDPIIGSEVIGGRIIFDMTVNPGFDAADFETLMTFPIDPAPGSQDFWNPTGASLGWSGSGDFSINQDTDMFNGTFISSDFFAQTILPFAFGDIDFESRVELDYLPVPAPAGATLLAMTGLWTIRRRR